MAMTELSASTRAKTATNVGVMVLASLGIFAAINWLGGQPKFRSQYDASSLGSNTLSDKSSNLLASLADKIGKTPAGQPQVIELVSFLSAQSRLEDKAIQMVHQLTEVYQSRSNGAIRFRKMDPDREPRTAIEKAKELKLSTVGFDLVMALGDRVRTMRLDELVRINPGSQGNFMGGRNEPARIEENRIEETITSNLLAILEKDKPKIYVLGGHGEPSIEDTNRLGLSYFADGLRKAGYDVAELNLAEKRAVPADAKVLVWMTPAKKCTPEEMAALKEYASKGGRFLIALDPALEPGTDASVTELLGRFSLKAPDGLVCMPVFDVMTGSVVMGVEECAKVYVKAADLSSTHPVTKSFFEQRLPLVLVGVRPLERALDSDSKALVEDLARSRKDAWIDLPPENLALDEGKEKEQIATVVAAATWSVDTASAPADGKAAEGRALVVGSSMTARNVNFDSGKDFFLSCAEWLAGREFAAGIGPKVMRRDSTADLRSIASRSVGTTFFLAALAFAGAGIVVYLRRQSLVGLVLALFIAAFPLVLGIMAFTSI